MKTVVVILRALTYLFIIISMVLLAVTLISWNIAEPGFEPVVALLTCLVSGGFSVLGWISSRSLISYSEQRDNKLNTKLINTEDIGEQEKIFRTLLGVENPKTHYENTKYETYIQAWRILQKLNFAGDDLWEKVSEKTISIFFEQLYQAQRFVGENAIYFEDEDYKDLRYVLNYFDEFLLGKSELQSLRFGIREKENTLIESQYQEAQIQARIEANRDIKNKYENLLEKIRVSFKKRLSS